MKPIIPLSSPLKYYSARPKKALVICLVIVLSVCAVAFVASMLTGYLDDNYTCLKPLEFFSCVTPAPTESSLSDALVEKIASFDETETAVRTSVQSTLYRGLVAGIGSPVYTLFSQEDAETLLNAVGDTLSRGRMPDFDTADDGVFEIVMHERLLKNKGLDMGDTIGTDTDPSEGLRGSFLIVGSIDGDVLTSFANGNPSTPSDATETLAILVFPKDGRLDALNARLATLGKDEATVDTYEVNKEIMRAQTTTLYALAALIVAVMSAIIAVSLGALVYIEYNSRSDEFGILYAMGYRKKSLARKIAAEICCVMAFGWVTGYTLSLILLAIINAAILAPNGQALAVFHWFGLVSTLIIPIVVSLCAVLPVLSKLNKNDPVTIIERRD